MEKKKCQIKTCKRYNNQQDWKEEWEKKYCLSHLVVVYAVEETMRGYTQDQIVEIVNGFRKKKYDLKETS